jgi:predicted transcriptional regulator
MTKAPQNSEGLLLEILSAQQTQLIISLAQAGLTRHQIRETLKLDMNRVTRTLKYLKKNGKENGENSKKSDGRKVR